LVTLHLVRPAREKGGFEIRQSLKGKGKPAMEGRAGWPTRNVNYFCGEPGNHKVLWGLDGKKGRLKVSAGWCPAKSFEQAQRGPVLLVNGIRRQVEKGGMGQGRFL